MTTHLHNPLPALVNASTPITIKISTDSGDIKKLRLPLRELEADTLVNKLRHHLKIPDDRNVIFERFSDSLGGYVKLDKSNRDVYKALQRAAKAKLKLRLKATTVSPPNLESPDAPDRTNLTSLQHQQSTIEQAFARASTSVQPIVVSQGSIAYAAGVPSHQSAIPGVFDFKTDRRHVPGASATSPPPSVSFAQDSPASSGPVASIIAPTVNTTSPHDNASLWVIRCNRCDQAMTNVHFHCSVCDAGDFDLCESCVAKGEFCDGKEHWLVKQTIENGQIVSSTTERLPPKKQSKPETLAVRPPIGQIVEPRSALKSATPGISGRITTEPDQIFSSARASRTCNNCIHSGTEDQFVNCKDCPDFDLCLTCHSSNLHGHHPAHTFQAACDEVKLSSYQKILLRPGRRK